MSELLPTLAATSIREGLLDYLETTFSLADQDARAALNEFLEHPSDGIFKGPYVRLRLPFRPPPTAGGTPSTGTRSTAAGSRRTGTRRRRSRG